MLLDEANIVVERVNGEEVTRTTLLRLAISGALSNKAAKLLDKKINDLNVETAAYERDDEGRIIDGAEGR